VRSVKRSSKALLVLSSSSCDFRPPQDTRAGALAAARSRMGMELRSAHEQFDVPRAFAIAGVGYEVPGLAESALINIAPSTKKVARNRCRQGSPLDARR